MCDPLMQWEWRSQFAHIWEKLKHETVRLSELEPPAADLQISKTNSASGVWMYKENTQETGTQAVQAYTEHKY